MKKNKKQINGFIFVENKDDVTVTNPFDFSVKMSKEKANRFYTEQVILKKLRSAKTNFKNKGEIIEKRIEKGGFKKIPLEIVEYFQNYIDCCFYELQLRHKELLGLRTPKLVLDTTEGFVIKSSYKYICMGKQYAQLYLQDLSHFNAVLLFLSHEVSRIYVDRIWDTDETISNKRKSYDNCEINQFREAKCACLSHDLFKMVKDRKVSLEESNSFVDILRKLDARESKNTVIKIPFVKKDIEKTKKCYPPNEICGDIVLYGVDSPAYQKYAW